MEGSFADRNIAREVPELTSRESTNKVADTKRRLALAFTEKEHIDVVLATNMISVGLDITRLGLMVVLGQPKAAAEYIQATSRVGRDAGKPGLVVTLLNVHRPRDRSHFERFEAFHAAFYRSVEATSATSRTRPRAAGDCGGARTPWPDSADATARRTWPRRPPHRTWTDCRHLVSRARAHCSMDTAEAQRLEAIVRVRVGDLLDSWAKVAQRHKSTGSRLAYQTHELGSDGPHLLFDPLDPELLKKDADARKFRVPRSPATSSRR